MKEKHCMVDVETMSSDSDAAIIQIGAVIATLDDGIIARFEKTILPESALKYGKASGSTLKWWMGQSEDARKSAWSGDVTLPYALSEFFIFSGRLNIDPNASAPPMQFWAHATFDFPVIDHAYKIIGGTNPIPFRQTRDMRTVESFYGGDIEWDKRDGIHHTALADAEWQMTHLLKMLRVHENQKARRTKLYS